MVSALSGGVNILLNYLLIPGVERDGAAVATGISYLVFFWGRTLISPENMVSLPPGEVPALHGADPHQLRAAYICHRVGALRRVGGEPGCDGGGQLAAAQECIRIFPGQCVKRVPETIYTIYGRI